MIWRSVQRALLLLLITLPGVSAATTSANQDSEFATAMRVPLFIDAADALSTAEAELARTSAAGRMGAPVHRADILWVIAQARFRLGDNDGALDAAEQITQLRLPAEFAERMHGNLALLRGHVLAQRGDFSEALRYYRTAQRAYIGADYQRGQGLALIALATLYNRSADYESSFRHFTLAGQTYNGDTVFAISLLNNLGTTLLRDERPERALPLYRRASALSRQIGAGDFDMLIQQNLATALINSENLVEAEQVLQNISQDLGTDQPLRNAEFWRAQATISIERGQTEVAENQIARALAAINPESSDPNLRFVHAIAYRIFSSAGRPQDALAQLEQLRRIEEIDERLTSSNRASLIRARFQMDAQEARMNNLQAQQLERTVIFERNRADMQRRLAIVLVAAGTVVLGLLVNLLFVAWRSRNRARQDEQRLALINSDLEAALAAKTQFLAATSHEMRTPLNGIIGMTQVMLADAALAADIRDRVTLVDTAGRSMRALVDDILDAAKLEQVGFAISQRPTDVGALLEQVVAQFKPTAADEGLFLNLQADVPEQELLIDPDRLRQVIVNLVGNGIKFTEAGGVTVKAHCIEQDGQQQLQIDVEDTGIGIDEAEQDQVFELFHQVDASRKRRFGGSGLGLAICRRLARAMGGDLTLTSAAGRGSVFTLFVPVQSAANSNDAADNTPPAILVVAADLLRSALLTDVARRSGQQVTTLSLPQLADATPETFALAAGAQLLVLDVRASSDERAHPLLAARGAEAPLLLVGEVENASRAVPDYAVSVPFAVSAILQALSRFVDFSGTTADSALRLTKAESSVSKTAQQKPARKRQTGAVSQTVRGA